jgi:hypothetical protein
MTPKEQAERDELLAWIAATARKQRPTAHLAGRHERTKPMSVLAGYKTMIAAILAALVAANAILHVVPDDVQNAFLAAAAALGFYGLHDQAERNKEVVVAKTDEQTKEITGLPPEKPGDPAGAPEPTPPPRRGPMP